MRLITISLVLAMLAVSACNTVQGLGTDIKKAGEGLERAGQ